MSIEKDGGGERRRRRMNKGFANRPHLKILASMITSHLLDFVVVGNRATKEEEGGEGNFIF